MPKSDADADFKIRLLKTASDLRAGAEADLAELARVGKVAAYQAGKPMTKGKGEAALFFVIQSGVAVELTVEAGAKDAILVALHGPGAVIGLVSALIDSKSETTSKSERQIEALSNLQAFSAPAADLLRVARRNPELMTEIAATLARENLKLARLYVRSTDHSLEMRLAAFFAEVADLSATDDWSPVANIGKLSQSSIASMLGVSREHVNRTLAMWERSGLIFQNKKGEILVQNARRLERLAESKSDGGASDRQDDHLWEVDAHLDRGLNQAALHLALEAARRAPKDLRYMHRAVLATARMGAISEALALLDKNKLGRDPSDEELACLKPRLLRDLAFAGGPAEPDQKHLLASAREYEKVFDKTGGYYPGVNAAAGYALAGDKDKAKLIARSVTQILTKSGEDIEAEETYWRSSTFAECKLLEGDKAAAGSLFDAASNAEDATPGKKATTRKQLFRLARNIGIDKAWINRVTPQKAVAYFCGPIARAHHDPKSLPFDRLLQQLDDFVEERPIGWAYGALASGADIAIAEALLEAGAELNVYLPTPPQEFLKSSVLIGGEAWRERFVSCMRRAASIEWNRRSSRPCKPAFRLGTEIAMGRAVRHASQLETDPVGFFAVPDDRDSKTSLSHLSADLWRARGFETRTAPQKWPGPPPNADAPDGDLEIFFALILEEGGARLPKSLASAGDLRFRDPESGLDIVLFRSLDAALAAADPLISGGAAGGWHAFLDAGVLSASMIATKPAEAAANLIAAACRPMTEPSKVYASEPFACVAPLRGVCANFEYVGFVQTREKLDPCAMYLVRA
jgi:CRP-like cAMP-binding protein